MSINDPNGVTPQPLVNQILQTASNPVSQALTSPQQQQPAAQQQAPWNPTAAIQAQAQNQAQNYNTEAAYAAANPQQAPQSGFINASQSQTQGAPQQAPQPQQNPLSVQGTPVNQSLQDQVAQDVANPLGTYGSNTTGSGTYAANLNPALNLNPRLATEMNSLVTAGETAQQQALAKQVGKDSPYYNALENPTVNNIRGNNATYNSDGMQEVVLPYAGAYQFVLQNATAAGQTIPPDLAAALQAMDQYAGSHNQTTYGGSGGSVETNFGGGDGGVPEGQQASGYYTDPIAQPGAPGFTPGPTGAITPTGPSMQQGGLFGDDAQSAFPGYQGGSQPNIQNWVPPEQQGLNGVQQAAAVIRPPAEAPPGVDPGTVQYPGPQGDMMTGAQQGGNPQGNSPVYTPQGDNNNLSMIEPMLSQMAAQAQGMTALSPDNGQVPVTRNGSPPSDYENEPGSLKISPSFNDVFSGQGGQATLPGTVQPNTLPGQSMANGFVNSMAGNIGNMAFNNPGAGGVGSTSSGSTTNTAYDGLADGAAAALTDAQEAKTAQDPEFWKKLAQLLK